MKIGVDLGGTAIKIGVVDSYGKILCKDSIVTQASSGQRGLLNDIAALCLSLVEKANFSFEDISSIGIGSAGCCDVERGVILKSANVSLDNVAIVDEISALTSKRVFLENDANCAALGEKLFGAAKDVDTSATITIGTGIGCGMIVGGNIYHGFNFLAGEVGHMCIVVDGEQCSCGRKGCFEKYASASALIALTRQTITQTQYRKSIIWDLIHGDLKNVTAKTAFDAARADDQAGALAVSIFIKYLGEGLLNLINILQPERLIIGGGVSNEGNYLIEPLNKMLKTTGTYTMIDRQTEIAVSHLKNDAGVIGAAMLG